MASATVPKSVCFVKPERPPHHTASRKSPSHLCIPSVGLFRGGHHTWKFVFDTRHGREIVRVGGCTRRGLRLDCSSHDIESSSSASSSSSDGRDEDEQQPPQEAVLKAISEVSKTEGRVGQTTNVIIGGTVTDDSTHEWLALDQKVNSYPTVRGFTAIGTGGDDFVQSMIVAVESVIQQPIPEGRIKQKTSSRGKYVSVNIGPIRVSSSEQVQAVYNAMRRDNRMKYFL